MNKHKHNIWILSGHLSFWVLSFVVLILIFKGSGPITTIDLVYTTIFHLTLIPLVYLNYFVGIPWFLTRKRYFFFALSTTISVILFSWLNDLLFSRFADQIFPGFYFVSTFLFQDIAIVHFIYILISTLFVLSGGWFRETENDKRMAILEKEKIHAELQMLKNQINPHFFFNTLQNLYALALKKSDELPGMILKLSDLMRYVIYEADVTKIELKKELEFIENYLELQKLRLSKNANINFEVTGNDSDFEIPPLLLIHFIENCFKHGLKGEINNAFANITLKTNTHTLTFTTHNNKRESESTIPQESVGTGIENVKRRLNIHYPNKHQLKIEEGKMDFKVYLKIDLS